jgi:hypothetical protein
VDVDLLNPIQILPVERNWRAIFVDPLTKEVVERVVVAWALCQPSRRPLSGPIAPTGVENSVHGVVHLDGKLVPAGSCTNFVGYLEPWVTRDQYLLRMR